MCKLQFDESCLSGKMGSFFVPCGQKCGQTCGHHQSIEKLCPQIFSL